MPAPRSSGTNSRFPRFPCGPGPRNGPGVTSDVRGRKRSLRPRAVRDYFFGYTSATAASGVSTRNVIVSVK